MQIALIEAMRVHWCAKRHCLSFQQFDDGKSGDLLGECFFPFSVISSSIRLTQHESKNQLANETSFNGIYRSETQTQTLAIFIFHSYIIWIFYCLLATTPVCIPQHHYDLMLLMCDNKINFRIKIWKITVHFHCYVRVGVCVCVPIVYSWHNIPLYVQHWRTDRIDLFWINSFSCNRFAWWRRRWQNSEHHRAHSIKRERIIK